MFLLYLIFWFLGGVNQIDYQYNFIGEVFKERMIYRRTGAADVTTLTEYERDNAGRVLQTWHSTNGKKRNLAVYEYDELGRLKRKKLASASASTITRAATPPNNTQDLASQWVQLLPGFSITPTSGNSYSRLSYKKKAFPKEAYFCG